MSADPGYTGRHRHDDALQTDGGRFYGQPGYEDDDPQVDTTMKALSDALLALAKASIAAETSEAQQTEGLLDDAEMIAYGFEPGSDEAMGVALLVGAIGRARDGAAS